MKPTCFDDKSATTALLRPGPLSANMHHQYAKRKQGLEKLESPLRGIDNIVSNTYSVIPYQEQMMMISKQVSGFDDNQADSLTRKIFAKKQVAKMPMLERCHIYGKKNCEGPEGWEDNNELPWYDPKGKYGPEIKGALANGYTEKEMKDYFELIQGYSSYLFNKSHAVAYSFTSMLTTWLKLYYPVEFYSAFLSMQATEDLLRYIPMIRKEGIDVKVPDINISNRDFTPDGNNILFGLGSIKGVGESSIPAIVDNRPYTSLEDALDKIGKKAFNKRVGEALIMSGAFNNYKANRNELLNEFHEIRKDKKIEILDIDNFNEDVIMDYEMQSLSCPVTCTPEWFDYEDGYDVFKVPIKITKIDERKDRKGNLMAFCEGDVGGGVTIELIIFSSIYTANLGIIRAGHTALFDGEKQSNAKLKVKKVSLS
uniref:DNA polymerase III subunit alpha n=1 Tax=Myoviridae sp. ctJ2i1 TaxID=2825079 RepID=A0A8S5V194_9CAUD|nr:MAG TPA: DNA polymerase III subunit alpha [Myoviridae sp. ctJ2i1]